MFFRVFPRLFQHGCMLVVFLVAFSGGHAVPTKKFKENAPSFSSAFGGRFLEHSFLEHFCIDQFFVIQGKFYMQVSRTPRLVFNFFHNENLQGWPRRPSQGPFRTKNSTESELTTGEKNALDSWEEDLYTPPALRLKTLSINLSKESVCSTTTV